MVTALLFGVFALFIYAITASRKKVFQNVFLLSAFVGLLSLSADAQVIGAMKVGENVMNMDDGSVFEIESSNGVLVLPRLTTAQRDQVATPLRGGVIFNITENCIQINYGTDLIANWQCVESNLLRFTTAGRDALVNVCLLYTSPSPRDATLSRMPSSA